MSEQNLSPAASQRQLCAMWQAHKARAMLHRAEEDLLTDFFFGESTPQSMEHSRAAEKARGCMLETLRTIETMQPRDAAVAAQMLEVAYDILTMRERRPGSTYAEGNVRAILSAVADALDAVGSTPIGNAALEEDEQAPAAREPPTCPVGPPARPHCPQAEG